MTLGRIIVDLLARTGSFETDLNRAGKLADRRAKEIDRAFRQAGKAIGLAMVAAATTATAAIKSSIDRMDDLSKAAQRANMPTEEFSRLAYAGNLADVSMEDLTKSMGKLAKAQGDAAQGLTTQVRGFEALGIAFKNADGSLRSTTEVFLDFADVFQKHKGSPEVMALGMQVFGRSFQNLIPLLKDGRDGLEAMAEEADRLGYTVSTEAGQAAEEFNDNLTRLKTAVMGLSNEVAASLLPDLVRLSGGLVDSASEGNKLKETADELAGFLRGLGEVAHWVSSAFEIMGTGIASSVGIAQSFATFLKGDFAESARQGQAAIGILADEYREAFADPVEAPVEVKFITPDSGQMDPRAFKRRQIDVEPLRITEPTKGGKKKGGKSEAEREAERLLQSYERLEASLKEQAALMGETTEVAKLRYELENGELAKLNQAQKDNLLGLAAELDAAREQHELQEEGKRLAESLLTPTEELNELRAEANELWLAGAISLETYNRALEAYREPGQQMLDDLRFELELLKMTNAERATAIQLRGMDAEQVAKYGQAIAQANQDIQDSLDQIDFMDGVRGEFEDFFVSLVDGSKSAGDALRDLFDNIAAMVTRMIAERWVEQMFGAMGTTGAGTSGGDWLGSLFGAFFGGGRAEGGPVGSGQTYLVGENGPELFVPRTSGTVIPAAATASMSGGTSIVQQIYVTGRVDSRTAAQMQQEAAVKQRRATTRNA